MKLISTKRVRRQPTCCTRSLGTGMESSRSPSIKIEEISENSLKGLLLQDNNTLDEQQESCYFTAPESPMSSSTMVDLSMINSPQPSLSPFSNASIGSLGLVATTETPPPPPDTFVISPQLTRGEKVRASCFKRDIDMYRAIFMGDACVLLRFIDLQLKKIKKTYPEAHVAFNLMYYHASYFLFYQHFYCDPSYVQPHIEPTFFDGFIAFLNGQSIDTPVLPSDDELFGFYGIMSRPNIRLCLLLVCCLLLVFRPQLMPASHYKRLNHYHQDT